MINIVNAQWFCCEDISLIENYEQAVNDTEKVWDCHHKLEIQENKIYHKEDLKDQGLYYKRPANELVFLTRSEHMKLHAQYNPKMLRPKSEDIRKRISETLKGRKKKPLSEETKRKMSETCKQKKIKKNFT